MKLSTSPLFATCFVFVLASLHAQSAVLFKEDFEAGLDQWTGRFGIVHNGIVVPDPLGSGRGHVLSFTGFSAGGDILSTNVLSSPYLLTISFDYLGLPTEGSVQGDLGGFFGIIETSSGNETWL